MNELIIIGILGGVFLVMIAIAEIIENAERIGKWLFDVQTAYYKYKHFKNRGVYAWERKWQ